MLGYEVLRLVEHHGLRVSGAILIYDNSMLMNFEGILPKYFLKGI